MDFSEFKLADTAKLKLRHPGTGEILTDTDGNVPTIELLSEDTEVARKANFDLRRNIVKEGAPTDEDAIFAKAERASAEYLATITVGWENIGDEGKQITYSREAAVEFYLKYPFVRRQVEAFCANRENFTSASGDDF